VIAVSVDTYGTGSAESRSAPCSVRRHGNCAVHLYYAHKAQPVSEALLEDAYPLKALFTSPPRELGVCGVRKLWHAARRASIDVSQDQVARS
jgi:hypothetical protein